MPISAVRNDSQSPSPSKFAKNPTPKNTATAHAIFIILFCILFLIQSKIKTSRGDTVGKAPDVLEEVKKMETKLYPLEGQQFTDRLAQRKIRELADMPPSLRAEVMDIFFKILRESGMKGTPIDIGVDDGYRQTFYLINSVQVVQNKKRDLGARLTTIAELDRRQTLAQNTGKKKAKVINHLIEIEALRAEGHSFPQIVKMLFKGKGKISVDYVKEIFYEQKKLISSTEPVEHEQPLLKIEPPQLTIEPTTNDFIKYLKN